MFVSRRKVMAKEAPPSLVLARIADEARALRPPTSSLYDACVQERLRARDTEVSKIGTALEQARAEGFAAAIRLMSLDAPERVLFTAFTELSSRQGDA